MNRSTLAGQTVKLAKDVKDPFAGVQPAGSDYRVEDYWINVTGKSWMFSDGNPAAMNYGIRSGMAGLPIDDKVLYGKIGHLGFLVHESELVI